jgi:hypothetical protein
MRFMALSTQARAALTLRPLGGEPILLAAQNQARWDQLLIRRGLAAPERAESLTDGKPGSQVLQAAIAARHARARRARRLPGQAGPTHRSAGGVRTGGVTDPQRAGADPAVGPRRRLRSAGGHVVQPRPRSRGSAGELANQTVHTRQNGLPAGSA